MDAAIRHAEILHEAVIARAEARGGDWAPARARELVARRRLAEAATQTDAPKGRDGKAAAKPGQPANSAEFERAHPRTRGGLFGTKQKQGTVVKTRAGLPRTQQDLALRYLRVISGKGSWGVDESARIATVRQIRRAGFRDPLEFAGRALHGQITRTFGGQLKVYDTEPTTMKRLAFLALLDPREVAQIKRSGMTIRVGSGDMRQVVPELEWDDTSLDHVGRQMLTVGGLAGVLGDGTPYAASTGGAGPDTTLLHEIGHCLERELGVDDPELQRTHQKKVAGNYLDPYLNDFDEFLAESYAAFHSMPKEDFEFTYGKYTYAHYTRTVASWSR